jgi:hypothetical protein
VLDVRPATADEIEAGSVGDAPMVLAAPAPRRLQ